MRDERERVAAYAGSERGLTKESMLASIRTSKGGSLFTGKVVEIDEDPTGQD